jgi:hypothetical protein
MPKRRSRPVTTIVYYRGVGHSLDLAACWRALVRRQVEGAFDSMAGLADAAGASRSTCTRFFGGRSTSLRVTLRILTALGLHFDDVTHPLYGGSSDTDDGPLPRLQPVATRGE